MSTFRIAPPLVLVLVLGVCACVAQAERLTEPKGLITFDMPAGWSNERFRNGRHFTREGKPDDPNVLGVVPERRDVYMTLTNMRELRKLTLEAQDHPQVFERTTRRNEFEVWEVINEATIRDQDVVFHTYLMFSDELMVEVHLNASEPVYKEYLPDLRSVVESISITAAGTTSKP